MRRTKHFSQDFFSHIFLQTREYHGLNKDGDEVEMQHALTTKIGDGQVKENPSFISKHLNMNIIS